jgi:hypothetical protein
MDIYAPQMDLAVSVSGVESPLMAIVRSEFTLS